MIGKALAEELASKELKHILIFAEGMSIKGEALINGVNDAIDSAVTISGGMAGDNPIFKHTWVIADIKPTLNSITAIGFYGENLFVSCCAEGGWEPMGLTCQVTRSEGSILYELDGKPALAVYKDYLGARAEQLPGASVLFPIAIKKDSNDEKWLLRTILEIDETNQTMKYAGEIPKGWCAQFMTGNPDKLIDAALSAVFLPEMVSKRESETLSVLLSCIGRALF